MYLNHPCLPSIPAAIGAFIWSVTRWILMLLLPMVTIAIRIYLKGESPCFSRSKKDSICMLLILYVLYVYYIWQQGGVQTKFLRGRKQRNKYCI